jgi:ribonuclease I
MSTYFRFIPLFLAISLYACSPDIKKENKQQTQSEEQAYGIVIHGGAG